VCKGTENPASRQGKAEFSFEQNEDTSYLRDASIPWLYIYQDKHLQL
jgi:hypothetical protein